MKFRTVYFKFKEKPRSMRRDSSREDTGHSSSLETRRNGLELSVIHLKGKVIPQPHRWWNDSKKLVIPVFKSISSLSRGILT